MLSVEQALQAITNSVSPAESRATALDRCLGLVLAEDVLADGDSPPFDKALMDGYAMRSSDFSAAACELRIVGEITAGRTAERELETGETFRIMTGAPLPPGVDCVIPVERVIEKPQANSIVVDSQLVRPGANLARRGESLRKGDPVLARGALLGPVQLGALAEMGRATVPVVPQATVGILATGDELVPYQATPGVGQIRNSNEIMLIAQTARAGAKPLSLGIASDQETVLQAAIQRGFESDILCLSGGVSMGTRDLVPAMLAELGVETIFHGCDMKPGKPIFFGALPAERASDHRPRWIFGLPGNPVSSMVCFELFVSTAIRRRMGISSATPHFEVGRLTESRLSKDSRPTYFPAEVQTAQDGLAVRPLNWRGSFDLQSTAHANGLVYFPTAREYAVGESVRVLRLDGRSSGCEKT